jgi:mRNA-degrading endonuclease toxin of MazEF toxin-antitoxin module
VRRGAVHWVSLDKRRPAIIVSADPRNRIANDVVVIPCSTSAHRMRWHVGLRRGEGGLTGASMAKCEQITTLPKGDVEAEELGLLSPARMREIERALLSALAIEDAV